MPASNDDTPTTTRATEPAPASWSPPDPLEIPELESGRLVVRAYRLDDAPDLLDTIVNARDQLMPWAAWAKAYRDKTDATKFIADQIVAARDTESLTGVGLGVFERRTGELIGGSGFHNLDRQTGCAETGYWVRPDRWGMGYAGEACARMISWMLLAQDNGGFGLNRVVVYVHGGNDRSVRVMDKLGVRKELHQRAHKHHDTVGIVDWHGWGVLAHEWDCATHRSR